MVLSNTISNQKKATNGNSFGAPEGYPEVLFSLQEE